MTRILTLDASMAVGSAGLVENEVLLGWRRVESDLAALPSLVEELLADHGRSVDLVAVIVGPGSFTGLRASIALAHGVGLAAGAPVLGVTVGAAFPSVEGRPVWAVVDSKRGRAFLERDGRVESVGLEALPMPSGPIALGGDAAFLDASARGNPIVAGLDHLFDVRVRHHAGGQITARAEHRNAGHNPVRRPVGCPWEGPGAWHNNF